MKKFILTILLICSVFVLVGCSKKTTLYLLNWGDYMEGDLIAQFEKKYNCKVEEIGAESNEEMYNRIVNNSYPIDVAIPSDYMIQKLAKENFLKEIDYSALENYSSGMFDDQLEELRADYDDVNQLYSVPYFWGVIGIMYNDRTPGVEEAIKANGWNVFFEPALTSSSTRIGMYNNPRDSIAAAELYLGYSLNTTSMTELEACQDLLLKQKSDFTTVIYGGDQLKSSVAGGKNLDFALVYSGDFFDQYSVIVEEQRDQYINFFVPDKTNIYFDAMVIPTTSKQTDLAHKFIDFFLDTDNIVTNVEYVGYCPAVKAAYDALLEDEYWAELADKYPFHPTSTNDGRIISGELYNDLGDTIYQKMDDIYRAASNA